MALPLSTVERAAICGALAEHRGDRDAAAHDLGIGRTTLYRKIIELKIAEDEYLGEGMAEAQERKLDEYHQELMDGYIRDLEVRHARQIQKLQREHLDRLQQISRLITDAHIA